MRRSNNGAARAMQLGLADRGSKRSSPRRSTPAHTSGVANSLARLAVLPVCVARDALDGDDRAILFEGARSVVLADPVHIRTLSRDSLRRNREDVVLLDARNSRAALVYRAIVTIRAAGWTRGIVLLLDPSDLAVVPVSSAVGATEFILSTATPAELEARLRHQGARPNGRGARVPIAPTPPGIQLLWRTHQVSFEGTTVSLTLRELQLLDVLMERGREVITAPDLARLAWGASKRAAGALATTYVCSLRKKLAWFGGSFGIQTVRGVGYRFIA